MLRGMDYSASDYRGALSEGLACLGLTLSEAQQEQLLAYLDLLFKWNKTFNLSGVRDKSEMLSRHLLDSLTLATLLTGKCILDVGTGPGLPGIPLAICFPDKQFVLLDSNGKKTRFVFQATLQLSLQNVEVHNGRVERFRETIRVDTIVSRAFSSLVDMVTLTQHLLRSEESGEPRRVLAMKGQLPADELASLPSWIVPGRLLSVRVPGCDGERHIVELLAKNPE
jgi:16S rRNA (guanine527-N7)-methyltransferase